MNVDSSGVAGSVAATSLNQQAAANQKAAAERSKSRAAQATSQQTLGIEQAAEGHGSSDRDADGRRLLVVEEQKKDGEEQQQEPHGLDATGHRGSQLDVSG